MPFNGGKLQVNLAFINGGAAYPYLNCMKMGGNWALNFVADSPDPNTLDSLGYPTSISQGGVKTTFNVPTQAQRPGNYVVTWASAGGTTTAIVSASDTVLPTATFTGSVTSNVLTAGAPSGGTIQKGMTLSVGGIIGDQISGSAGVAGTYSVIGGSNAGSQSMSVSGGSKSTSGSTGRYVFSTTTGSFTTGCASVGMSDMKVFHVDDEAAINAGQIFGAKFKQRLAEGNYGVIRFLNWQLGNTTNVTTWATRKTQNYATYGISEFRSALYAGSTSVSGLAYSVSAPSSWSGLVDKATVHIKFSSATNGVNGTFTASQVNIGAPSHGRSVNDRVTIFTFGASYPGGFAKNTIYYVVSVPDANTLTLSATQGGTAITPSSTGNGTPTINPVITMNVGGTGDIDIRDHNSNYVNVNSLTYPTAANAQKLGTIVYDATLNSWIKFGGDAGLGATGFVNGMPVEDMLQLCSEVGAHPWFVSPMLAVDPATDYFPSLAKYCKDNAPSWMIPRFEGPNELWNTANGFLQTSYANMKAGAYGWGADFHNWYGKVMSVLGQMISGVYAADRTKYQVMGGVQTFNSTSIAVPRMTSALYIGTTPQVSLTGSWGTINFSATAGVAEAYRWITHGVVAQYFAPSTYASGTETTAATAFAGKKFNASVSGSVLTVNNMNGISNAAIAVGDTIYFNERWQAGSGPVASTVTIASLGTGAGTTGTYNLSASVGTVASMNMTAATDPSQIATYVATLANSGSFSLPACRTQYAAWRAFFQGYGIQGFSGYEGGYSPQFAGTGDSSLDMFRGASKVSPNLLELARTAFKDFVAAGGTFPAMFQLSGSVYKGYVDTAWSNWDDVWQTPASPGAEASRLFGASKRRMVW